MNNWHVRKWAKAPCHTGVKNGFSIKWGWSSASRSVQSMWSFGIELKLAFHTYGLAVVRETPWPQGEHFGAATTSTVTSDE